MFTVRGEHAVIVRQVHTGALYLAIPMTETPVPPACLSAGQARVLSVVLGSTGPIGVEIVVVGGDGGEQVSERVV